MKKYIAFIATLLFFASVTVFTLPMMQDDANADLPLTEKVTIMANAGDGGGGDGDDEYVRPYAYKNGHYCCLDTQYTACPGSFHCDDIE